jgi:hypothetical protein
MNVLLTILIIAGGAFNLGFGIYHLTFWKTYRWSTDLPKISRLNQSVVQIINLCLAFMIFAMAFLSFFYFNDLIATALGNVLLFIMFMFWLLRMVEQVIFFGTKNRTAILFTFIFLAGSLLYLAPFILVLIS